MKSIAEVTNDLKEIRYYCRHQILVDSASRKLGNEPQVWEKINVYNEAAAHIPVKYYVIYSLLVIDGKSVKECAAECAYSEERVRHLYQESKRHFQEYLARKEKKNG